MRWGIIAALVLWCGFCAAEEVDLETVRETLDKAMDSCFEEIIELDEDITERIDRLIKMAGIRGDLDTVEELQRQRETYLITGFLLDSPVHLLIRRKAQLVINRVQIRLDQAYEQAVEILTKEGRYADARRIKNERLNLYKKLSADQVELQRTNIIKQARERRELLQQQPEEQGVSSDLSAAGNDKLINKNNFNDDSDVYTNSIGMKLRAIPLGQFLMQGTTKATITKPFYIGVYEVTQKEWKAVMGSLPENTKTEGDDMPAQGVSWNAATEFCQKLSNMPDEKANRCVYRLPTETEWEYSCRGGTTTKYFFGDDLALLNDYAWHIGNSSGTPHAVGLKKPNAAGLHDMHGNVTEWVQDWMDDIPLQTINYFGPEKGAVKVFRGGSWSGEQMHLEVSDRNGNPDLNFDRDHCGLRVVMTRQVPKAETIQVVSSDTKMTVVSGQTKIELVEVNDLGNPPDKTGYGSVNYKYLIGRYEITIEQYCVFLNAVASEKDPHRLFDESRMTDDPNTMSIKRSGQPGNYAYEPMRFAKYATNLVPGCVLSSRRPMSQVSWMDAARFCNWLHNGQGDGDTETGTYMIGQGNSRPVRQPNARYFLPTENEWYKAAYYHQLDNDQFAYTKYATSTNIEPTKWIDTYNPHYSEEVGQWVPRFSRTNDLPNIANWGRHGGHFDTLAPVDHFPMSRSNYGCQGMTGNVDEYVEDGFESPRICRRGGNWWNSPNNHPDSLYRREAGLYDKGATEGFRIAGLPQN